MLIGILCHNPVKAVFVRGFAFSKQRGWDTETRQPTSVAAPHRPFLEGFFDTTDSAFEALPSSVLR
jgi:hypothetical protein